jgi:hypothetical protein
MVRVWILELSFSLVNVTALRETCPWFDNHTAAASARRVFKLLAIRRPTDPAVHILLRRHTKDSCSILRRQPFAKVGGTRVHVRGRVDKNDILISREFH